MKFWLTRHSNEFSPCLLFSGSMPPKKIPDNISGGYRWDNFCPMLNLGTTGAEFTDKALRISPGEIIEVMIVPKQE